MGTVTVAKLRKNLSSYLRRVRAGEEIVIRDRSLPVCKIVPLRIDDIEEASLVAAGLLTLPKKKLDLKRFWAIGRGARANPKLTEAIRRVVQEDRGWPVSTSGVKRRCSR